MLLLLHELGHGFVARRFGLEVEDIVLWPLGGMARIREMPESSRVEAWVAAAGPAVNFALALAALPIVLLASSEPTGVLPIAGNRVPMREGFEGFATHFLVLNLGFGLFNLVPAFPMDGGRLLRAFLGRGGRDEGDRSGTRARGRDHRLGHDHLLLLRRKPASSASSGSSSGPASARSGSCAFVTRPAPWVEGQGHSPAGSI